MVTQIGQPMAALADTLDLARTELERTSQRWRKGLDVLLGRNDPPVGATPKDIIYSQGTLKLYRYRPFSDEVYRVPVVLVMSLISKPYILDLTPGQSFVEYLLRQGFDVFMLDWGVPRPQDRGLRLENYVLEYLPRCLEEVQQVTEEQDYSIFGYCMGGHFGLMYASLFPKAPLKNLVCVATPVNMEGMGLFRLWSDRRYFDVDQLVDTLGNIPGDLLFRSFEMLRPMDRWGAYMRLWDNLWNDLYVLNFRVLNKWVGDQIPFPGECYRQVIKELMWENKLMRGELRLDGQRVDIQRIRCPFLHIMAEHDHIAPFAATQPLSSLVGSTDKEDVILKGGHVSLVAGRNAILRLWPKVSQWLAERSV